MTAFPPLVARAARSFAALVKALLQATHNSFALIGLAVLFTGIALVARPELRQFGEVQLFGWLQERQVEITGVVSDLMASDRATAANLAELPKAQAGVALWLSKKYKVAPEPVGALVAEAYALGPRQHLDPTLILAVMAVESGFNPFAQSTVGAQGLMQVMTTVHGDKYQLFGGKLAAFDPLSNLRVGAKVLSDCIRTAGSVEGGLKAYVGAANNEDDGGYVAKVMAEHGRLQQVALGRNVPMFPPAMAPANAAELAQTPATRSSASAMAQPPADTATVAWNATR